MDFILKEFHDKLVLREMTMKKQMDRLSYPNEIFCFTSPQGWKRLDTNSCQGCFILITPKKKVSSYIENDTNLVLRLFVETDLVHKNEENVIYIPPKVLEALKSKEKIVGLCDNYQVNVLERDEVRILELGVLVPLERVDRELEGRVMREEHLLECFLKERVKLVKRGQKIYFPFGNKTLSFALLWKEEERKSRVEDYRWVGEESRVVIYLPSFFYFPFVGDEGSLIGEAFSTVDCVKKIDKSFDPSWKILNLFLESLNVDTKNQCKSLLIHGPSGTGKSSVLMSGIRDSGVNCVKINWNTLHSLSSSSKKVSIQKLIDKSVRMRPSVLLLDDAESLFAREMEDKEQLDLNFHFSSSMEKFLKSKESDGIMLVVISRDPCELSKELRSICEEEFEFEVPLPKRRKDIFHSQLESLLCKNNETSKLKWETNFCGKSVDKFSDKHCHGMVGADIAYLCNKAFLYAYKRYLTSNMEMGKRNEEKNISVEEIDFLNCLKEVKSKSSSFDTNISIPQVKWEDIGGLENIKQQLRESITWIYEKSDALERMGLKNSNSIILYGEPGVGECSLLLFYSTQFILYQR